MGVMVWSSNSSTFSFVSLDRIKKCGGFVSWNSVGQPHVNGRLAMTRSIGDLDLKNSGVIAQPETKRVQVKEGVVYRDNNTRTKGLHRYFMLWWYPHSTNPGEARWPRVVFYWSNQRAALIKLFQININRIEKNLVLNSTRSTSKSHFSQ